VSVILRQLTTLAIALSAIGWSLPCSVWQGEFDLAVPAASAGVRASHHAAPPVESPQMAHTQADPHAHHHPTEPSVEPAAEWQPVCPCGCEQAPEPGSPGGRIGYALIPVSPLTGAMPAIAIHSSALLVASDPDARAIDHVPIPS
jgi:hypothetical protein